MSNESSLNYCSLKALGIFVFEGHYCVIRSSGPVFDVSWAESDIEGVLAGDSSYRGRIKGKSTSCREPRCPGCRPSERGSCVEAVGRDPRAEVQLLWGGSVVCCQLTDSCLALIESLTPLPSREFA